MRASEILKTKKVYYHADGYIKAIGKNARRTIYHPNLKISTKWHYAVVYLISQRHKAWVKLHPQPQYPVLPRWLLADFTCIHGYEGSWVSNTGNGYYGGMQMDLAFQKLYGPDFYAKYGTADNWPIRAQLTASARAYSSGRGFGPWPNTARACGLL
jgi:hypothetical protein